MRLKNLLVLLLLIFLYLTIPVIGELTDYQKGVNDGLASSLRIGYQLGKAPYDINAAQQYNSMVDPFNTWLQAVFGANKTAVNLFWMKSQVFGMNQIATNGAQTTTPTNQGQTNGDVF